MSKNGPSDKRLKGSVANFFISDVGGIRNAQKAPSTERNVQSDILCGPAQRSASIFDNLQTLIAILCHRPTQFLYQNLNFCN